MKNLIVQKFGGTSVASVERIREVAKHVAATVRGGHNVLVVISAMGHQTDELLALAHSITATPPRRELDMLLTAGERISMALLSIALSEEGTPAASFTGSQSGIMTDTVHGNARISRISAQRIESTLAQGSVAIVAGFQGVSQETKEITTLGRGGSDLTAIALAGHLKAASCQLYKDVDGVYEADPRLVPQARKIDQISWNTMLEMAWSGASVLHSRGAHLAARFEIPVEIRSSFNLNKLGTIVSGKAQMEKFVVEAISQKENMCILSGTIPGNKTNTLNDLRAWLWEKGETSPVQFQHYQSNETSFQWLLPANLAVQAKKLLEAEKGDDFQITPCGVLTIVGSGFWQSPEIIPSIQEDIKCPLLMDIKNCTITLAVESSALKKQMVTLHEKLMLHKSQKKISVAFKNIKATLTSLLFQFNVQAKDRRR